MGEYKRPYELEVQALRSRADNIHLTPAIVIPVEQKNNLSVIAFESGSVTINAQLANAMLDVAGGLFSRVISSDPSERVNFVAGLREQLSDEDPNHRLAAAAALPHIVYRFGEANGFSKNQVEELVKKRTGKKVANKQTLPAD